jgi:hypothetical protein
MADDENRADATPAASHWTIDKRLNIAALVGFVLTAASFIWYASQADARLATLEARVTNDGGRITTIEGKANSLELVQFRLTAVEATSNRIEAKVDQLREQR